MAECLRESIQWCFDCTFESSPSIFKQMLTVFGIYNDIPIPCAFAFLPNKEKKTYINVIKKIVNKVSDSNVNQIKIKTHQYIILIELFE
jgi:hypothetical protein